MDRSNLLSVFMVVLVTFSFVSVFGQICVDSSGTFKPNSTYDSNRRIILSYLASNVTARDGFLYNSSIGQEPDRVFAMGLCIQGSESNDCAVCITEGVTELIQSCPNNTEAFSWPGTYTLCMVRYAKRSFFGLMELEPHLVRYNSGIITSNVSEFHRIWDAFILRMIDSASSGQNEASSSSSGKYYAADVTSVTTFQRVYALMACTSDLSPGNCDACLRANVESYQECCRENIGGPIRRPNCFVRWDLYPFLGAFDNIGDGPTSCPTNGPTNGTIKNTNDVWKAIKGGNSTVLVVAIVVAIIVAVLLSLAGYCFFKKRAEKMYGTTSALDGDDMNTTESLQLDYRTIQAATNNYSENNKIGQGGFGEVYKGTFSNGTEVAVKRLSNSSRQGDTEFKNEVVVVAKLHHRNLVMLLGFCLEGTEKILVFEFVPNKSLDYFLFDPTKQGQLYWKKRYNIIEGITRGILYLHQDSQLKIIHRDLKADNILLDADMNPKIADFGMSRIFGLDQSKANTKRIAGTYGYMPPEYVMHGQFSMKSDVYSFGVLVLEIISGKRTSSFCESNNMVHNLVTHAWRLWTKGKPLDLVDPTIANKCQSEEVTRCIHIALLCVQKDPSDRPKLSTVMLMLTSNSVILHVPQAPGFFFSNRLSKESRQSMINPKPHTINDVTITDMDPR